MLEKLKKIGRRFVTACTRLASFMRRRMTVPVELPARKETSRFWNRLQRKASSKPITIYHVGTPAEMEQHARPLMGDFDVRIETAADVVRLAQPGDVCLFYNEFYPSYRTAIHQLRQKQCATLYAIDGIFEWRSLWEFPPGISCLWSARPILSHKMACIGRSQARIAESWGHADQCEIVGVPRFDRLLGRTPRVRPAHEPFTILILTAKAPGFDQQQLQRATRSLTDLRMWLESHPQIHGVQVQPLWRITQGLEQVIGVPNHLRDTTGDDLADVLTRVDAVITTPSTAMLEGMLQQLPVALLDYNNCPHYVPAAWTITSANHLDQVVPELVAPPLPKMLYQQFLLNDALECDGPALPRMCQLITRMHKIAKRCVTSNRPLSFPAKLLASASHTLSAHALPMDHARVFPTNPAFSKSDITCLQSEVGDLRASLAALAGLVADNGRLNEQLQATQSDLRAFQAHHARVVEWQRLQLEAAHQHSSGGTSLPNAPTQVRANAA